MAGPEPDYESTVVGASVWGWMTEPELLWLAEQAAQMDGIVEIGSLHGRSAMALLTFCRGPVYCIDPWDDEHDQCYGSFLSHVGHLPNLRAIRGRSPAVGAEVPGDVDMVFIDGEHFRPEITADIEYWLPRTRKLICGHDYYQGPDAGYPDVALVVDEMFGDRVTVAEGTSIWAVVL